MHHLPLPTAPRRPPPPPPNAEPTPPPTAFSARRVLVRLFRPPELFDPAPHHPSPPPPSLSSSSNSNSSRTNGSRSPSPDPLPVYTADPSSDEQVLDHNSRRRRRRAVTESYALELEQRRQSGRGRPTLRRRGYSVESVFFAATVEGELGDEGEGEGRRSWTEAAEGGAEVLDPTKSRTRVFVLPIYEADVVREKVQGAKRPGMGKRKWSWAGGLCARETPVGVRV